MTDSEIKRALECCASSVALCQECPHFTVPFPTCKELTSGKALQPLNRQKAEVERLKSEKDNLIKTYKECALEAVKEFAERLKEDIINIQMNGKYQHYAIPTKKVDKILKEMGAVE